MLETGQRQIAGGGMVAVRSHLPDVGEERLRKGDVKHVSAGIASGDMVSEGCHPRDHPSCDVSNKRLCGAALHLERASRADAGEPTSAHQADRHTRLGARFMDGASVVFAAELGRTGVRRGPRAHDRAERTVRNQSMPWTERQSLIDFGDLLGAPGSLRFHRMPPLRAVLRDMGLRAENSAYGQSYDQCSEAA